jgi:hypothetical protein
MSLGNVELTILIVVLLIYLAVPLVTLFLVVRLKNKVNQIEKLLLRSPQD